MLKVKRRKILLYKTAIGCLVTLSLLVILYNTLKEDYWYIYGKDESPITFQCNGGRLGNQMCSYAVLCGLAELNSRSMNIMPCNYFKLAPYFKIPGTLVNMTTFKERNPWKIINYLRSEDKCINRRTNLITGHINTCSFTFYHHIRKKITDVFTFRRHILDYAEQALLKVKGNRSNVTFVGIHVRRTDYVGVRGHSWLKRRGGAEVDEEYFIRATKYYKNKYPNVCFIAVSDDRTWCKEHLQQFGVHVMEPVPSPGHDMAILSRCNHTIMTYGSFGYWGSYLAGGEVIYFDKFLKPGTDFMKHKFQYENRFLPEWVGIATNSSYI